MNRLKLILVSGYTALLMSAALQAQTVTHYLTAEAGVGYSAGFLGEAGVGYAFADRLFLMRTGLEMAYTFRRMRVPDHTEQQGEVDSEDVPYTAVYDYTRQTDRLHLTELRVPLLAGVQWQNWYLLAGVKAGVLVAGKQKSEMDITKSGDYAMFNDIFEEMPNHGLTTDHQFSSASLPAQATAYATLETGMHWQYLGWAVFADYRLPGYSVDTRPIDRLTIGAKLTFWLGWQKRRSMPCMCTPQAAYYLRRR